jgi:hypothetical protein
MKAHEHGFGSSWNRRDFLSTIAGGAASLAFHREVYAAQEPPTVGVLILGTFLATKGDPADGAIDILIPKASGHSTHEDRSPAKKHKFRAGWVNRTIENGAEKLEEEESELPKTSLTLIGASNSNTGALSELIQMEKVLPKDAILLMDKHGEWSRFYSRVTLVGGTFATFSAFDSTGTWSIPKTFNDHAPQKFPATLGLLWVAGRDNVQISWTGKKPDIPSILTVANTPLMAFVHSKTAIKEWKNEQHTRPRHLDVDHDFKWFYRVFVPKGQEASNEPWTDLLNGGSFPAPTFDGDAAGRAVAVKPSTATTIDKYLEILSVGTPTCFGGCFGC